MELLSPAGSLEKLKYAVNYGADAVYASGKQFGLRAKAANLSHRELQEAVDFCHNRDKKIFVPVNIFAHNKDLEELPDYLRFLAGINIDAVIVSDPGVLKLVKEEAPSLPVHLSTQANTTSWKAARFWKEQGVVRIILARELTFAEVKEIKAKVPDIELEMFIHGAMCISYSGRCLISAFLNNRSANRGLCTHPCRWRYRLFEESRPHQYFPIEEDDRGSYVLNSKDLCLFDHLPEIAGSGIDTLKIEGRMKSLYYVANTTRIYRTAIDLLHKKGDIDQSAREYLKEELNKVSHREWTSGFFDGLDLNSQCYDSSSYRREYQFLGEIITVEAAQEILPGTISQTVSGEDISEQQQRKASLSTTAKVRQNTYLLYANVRAKFTVNDEIEIIFPDYRCDIKLKINVILDEDNNPLRETKPNTVIKLVINIKPPRHGILRKKIV